MPRSRDTARVSGELPKRWLVLLTLAVAGLTACAYAEADAAADAAVRGTLVKGLEHHAERLRSIQGALVLNTYYSTWAQRVERMIAEARADADAPIELDALAWRGRGCVYCDFIIDGDRWLIRAVKLANSGFREMAITDDYGHPYGPDDRNLHELTTFIEYSDGRRIIQYRPRAGRAEVVAFRPEAALEGLRGSLSALLLTHRGRAPMHELIAAGEPLVAEVADGQQTPRTYRLAWFEKDEADVHKRELEVATHGEFMVTRYANLLIRLSDHSVGTRVLIDTDNGATRQPDAIVPQQVTFHEFQYSSATDEPWYSTHVVTVLHTREPASMEAISLHQFLLPIGTQVFDAEHLLPEGSDSGRPNWSVGQLQQIVQAFLHGQPTPPAHDPAYDQPIREEDVQGLIAQSAR